MSNKEDLSRFAFKVLSFDVGTEDKSEHFLITSLKSHNHIITNCDL